ncbi:hypothetical protein DFH11DRAFT_1546383 [Phellopilus nigrolimitatus]|nr:hypothetical protein DFH11DRAFT_1546383 [Phellopilus nigrolimitatus]
MAKQPIRKEDLEKALEALGLEKDIRQITSKAEVQKAATNAMDKRVVVRNSGPAYFKKKNDTAVLKARDIILRYLENKSRDGPESLTIDSAPPCAEQADRSTPYSGKGLGKKEVIKRPSTM